MADSIRNLSGIIVVVISFLAIPLYIFLYISLFKARKSVFTLINFMFLFTCSLQSVSYLFSIGIHNGFIITFLNEKCSKDNWTISYISCYFCKLQGSINIFGEISKVVLATGFALIAFLTFFNPSKIERNKKWYFIGILIVCEVLPFIYATIILMYEEAEAISFFCCYSSILPTTAIIRYIVIFLFYVITISFIIIFAKTFKGQSNEEFYKHFKKKMISYHIVMLLTLLLFVTFSIVDSKIVSEDKKSKIYAITDVWDGILTPLYAIVFLFDERKREEFKQFICCTKNTKCESNLLELNDSEIDIM